MRAARIHELGSPPRQEDVAEPEAGDREVLDIVAVALNPLDLAIGAGRFYGGHPPLPYIPGAETVARRGDGSRVYAFGDGLGVARDGTLAERAPVAADRLLDVAEGVSDEEAVALGIAGIVAWTALTLRGGVGPGDRVLVLGATGASGSVAVQGARILGAERVVAAGRNRERLERARALGADDVVELEPADGLADRLRAAFGGDGPNVVVDPLWGDAAAAACEAAAPRARILHYGQSAGPTAPLTSAAVRGKELNVLGVSNFARTRDELQSAYSELLAHARNGSVRLDVETFPLDAVDEAWRRQAAGAKAVVTIQR